MASTAQKVGSDRKKIEQEWYDKLYGEAGKFASTEIREGILGASENYFLSRMKQLIRPGSQVLEIGCGEGQHAITAAKCGAQVTAIDISEEGLKVARKRAAEQGVAEKIQFLMGDVELLNLRESSFDLVVDHEVLSSVLFEPTIKSCMRVLNANGVFLGIECLGHNPIFNLNRSIKRVLGKRTTWATKNILKTPQLKFLFKHFGGVEVNYFHLFDVFFAPFRKILPSGCHSRLSQISSTIDRVLFSKGGLKNYAFKVVIEARGPTKDMPRQILGGSTFSD